MNCKGEEIKLVTIFIVLESISTVEIWASTHKYAKLIIFNLY